MRSAKRPHRREAAFFADPQQAAQRRYEALRAYFLEGRPGPRVAPAKQAARDQVLRLRAAGHSITEITQALATTTPLNRTGVWELLSEEGYERLPTRPTGQRGGPRRDHPPRTRRITWPAQPLRLPSDFAGLLLLVPGLVTLD